MTPVPERAAMLAAVALHDAECSDRHCSGPALGAFYRQARIALGAASAAVRADERESLASRLVPLLQAADSHITDLQNALWVHAGVELDDGPDLHAAIEELSGAGS